MKISAKALGIWLFLLAATSGAAADLRLVDAAKAGDKQAVQALLKQHVDVNAAQIDGATALSWAAYQDDVEIAGLLIAAGANANTTNDYGATPLILACANGSAGMVDKLLKAGANPKTVVPLSEETPLMQCSRTGSADGVKSLLDRGVDINAKENRQGDTALM
jgi:ankyrin repeat protein